MGCMFSQLASKFAFFPPTPPTYQIEKRENGKLAVVASSSSMPIPVADDTSLDILLIDTKRGNKIVAFYLKNPYARLTLLYSHGNAADLGQLYDLFVQLKVNLRVNLMGLNGTEKLFLAFSIRHSISYNLDLADTSSFFLLHLIFLLSLHLLNFMIQIRLFWLWSLHWEDRVTFVVLSRLVTLMDLFSAICDVQPSESNTYADIEAVYQCLQTEYGVSQEDLILYGQSVGSGPTLHLASKLPRLRGVVLHSGILSGLRVLCHVKFTFCFDIYANINKIQKVKCPVLVIHGTEDDVVNWLHGNKLWKMAREPFEPLWIKGGGHCNLELYPDYIRHLFRFIQEMENMNTKIRLNKIRQTIRLPSRSNNTRSVSTNRCCWIKCWRPKCPECPKPGCSSIKCAWKPKCPSCWIPSCVKCCQIPKCPSCLRPSCSCLKCFNWRCCVETKSQTNGKQGG
ncbi:hypothetical protein Pint_03514 [Pistacia integerrima]|uniref:Uncharacterized protein n=1 Tax=Pistacia integerrima TaxID=434235 RepID=A0ACC0ZGU5_9ROSI|nr:hypothetical protein Pint_03514 [Pistacia integerrima]